MTNDARRANKDVLGLSESHGKKCEICGKEINCLHGNPSLWGTRTLNYNLHLSCIERALTTRGLGVTDVHTKHCYQGEYEGSCKYMDDNCTAAPKKED